MTKMGQMPANMAKNFKGPLPSEKYPVVRKEGAMPSSGKGSSFLGQLQTMAMQDPLGLGSFLGTYEGGNGQIARKGLKQNVRDAGSAVSGNSGFNIRRAPDGTSVATSGGTSGLSGSAPQDPYIQEDSRYKDRAKFDQSLAEQAMNSQTNARVSEEERLMKLRMEMLNQLLGGGVGSLGSRGKTATSTQDTSGGEYQNIGGRPVWMPTSSKTRTTSNERGMSSEALLQALLSMIDG